MTQYPSDASTTRSYSVIDQALTFVSAPADGVAIQARHIGFAGATTSAVTGFYGRTGNAALISTDDISVHNISAGIATFNTIAVGGTVSIGGTLTYEDVTNIDSVGLVTARNGIVVGSGITLSKDGDVFFTGIATGNGSGLTALNATQLTSGTVPTARLGSGTASSSTFLRGDSSFQTVNTDLVSDTSPQLGGNLASNGNEIVMADNDKIKVGTGEDLHIFHDGNSRIQNTNNSSDFRIQSDSVEIKANSVDEYMIKGTVNGAVQLYNDNNLRLATTSNGIDVSGGVLFDQIDAIVGTPHDYLYGFNAATASQSGLTIKGAEASIEILASDGGNHGGSLLIRGLNDGYGFVNDADNNRLQLFSFASSADDFYIHGSGQNTSRRDLCLVVNQDAGVELYYDNSKRLETVNGGLYSVKSGQNDFTIGSSNAGGVYLLLDGDSNGDASGSDYSFIAHDTSGDLLIAANNPSGNGDIKFYVGAATLKARFDDSGNLRPETNNDVDLGNSNKRWRNIYTNDLNLSNEGGANEVDGTWGKYTIQEGETDLFLINNRSGKKYKFNLTEVS